MLDPKLTLEIRSQAPERVGVRMNWRDLLFLHYACDPHVIQSLLPSGLSVDTFPDSSGQEMAWIGVVLFRMENVRPRVLPVAGPCGNFPETNVRTYCHRNGADPGVWFFSLDAANPFACTYARRFYSLPYHEATMQVRRKQAQLAYRSQRWRSPKGQTNVQCELEQQLGMAQPGTFEFFLLERYLLFSQHRSELYSGQVFHSPYPMQEVLSWSGSTELLRANGLPQQAFSHAHFSAGVDVVAEPIKLVG